VLLLLVFCYYYVQPIAPGTGLAQLVHDLAYLSLHVFASPLILIPFALNLADESIWLKGSAGFDAVENP
jgi:hypothetical protein